MHVVIKIIFYPNKSLFAKQLQTETNTTFLGYPQSQMNMKKALGAEKTNFRPEPLGTNLSPVVLNGIKILCRFYRSSPHEFTPTDATLPNPGTNITAATNGRATPPRLMPLTPSPTGEHFLISVHVGRR